MENCAWRRSAVRQPARQPDFGIVEIVDDQDCRSARARRPNSCTGLLNEARSDPIRYRRSAGWAKPACPCGRNSFRSSGHRRSAEDVIAFDGRWCDFTVSSSIYRTSSKVKSFKSRSLIRVRVIAMDGFEKRKNEQSVSGLFETASTRSSSGRTWRRWNAPRMENCAL